MRCFCSNRRSKSSHSWSDCFEKHFWSGWSTLKALCLVSHAVLGISDSKGNPRGLGSCHGPLSLIALWWKSSKPEVAATDSSVQDFGIHSFYLNYSLTGCEVRSWVLERAYFAHNSGLGCFPDHKIICSCEAPCSVPKPEARSACPHSCWLSLQARYLQALWLYWELSLSDHAFLPLLRTYDENSTHSFGSLVVAFARQVFHRAFLAEAKSKMCGNAIRAHSWPYFSTLEDEQPHLTGDLRCVVG